jgi:hypothetical protein
MDRTAILRGRRSVYGRTDQRVSERRPLADRQQALSRDRICGRWSDAEPFGRAPQQQRIANRFRRRDQQKKPCIVR